MVAADTRQGIPPTPTMQMVLPWFIFILSLSRHAFWPSSFTSKEYRIQLASFMLVLETTPPAVPASSPTQRLNSEPFTAHMFPPSALTVVVPPVRSLDSDMITGYGIGIGPPGLGVLQTSGAVFFAK